MNKKERVFGEWAVFKGSKLQFTTNDRKEALETASVNGLLVIKTSVLIEKGYQAVINGQ